MNLEDFKELLKERDVKTKVPGIPADEIDEEVKKIMGFFLFFINPC